MKSTALASLIPLNETSNNEHARKIKIISSLLAINMINETCALAILHSPDVNEQNRLRIAKQFLTLNLLTKGVRLAAVHSLSENTHNGQADLQLVRVVHRVLLDHGQIGLGLTRTFRIVDRHDEQAARIRSVKTILFLNELAESVAFAALYP
jgi:hypothetical protein